MRFANPAEALGGRHLEALRQEARKLGGPNVGLGQFSDLFGSFLRTYNTYLYNELNAIENTSAKDYWEERCDLLGPLGPFLGPLGRSWELLGEILSPLPLLPASEDYGPKHPAPPKTQHNST